MHFSAVGSLADGLRRTFARNGLVLVLAVSGPFVLSALFSPAPIGLQPGMDGTGTSEPVVGDVAELGWIVTAFTAVSTLYLAIVAYRTFATEETKTIPREAIVHRPVWALVNVVLGTIVFTIAVVVGSFLLVVPGLFFLVTLWFYDVFIAVEDTGFLDGLGESWSLTAGHRIPLFGLGLVVVLLSMALQLSLSVPFQVYAGTPGLIVGQLATAVGTVFTFATTTAAFVRLRRLQGDGATPPPRR